MRVSSLAILLFMVVAITTVTAKKKKGKSGKKAPQWKPRTMPLLGKKFLYLDEGEDVSLDCKAKGKPKPKVKWYFNGDIMAEEDTIQMKKSGEMIIQSITPAMSGNYTCLVSNSQGDLEWTFRLQIQKMTSKLQLDGPRNVTALSGSRAQFACQVLNDPQAKISWFKGKVENRDFFPRGAIKELLILEDINKNDEGWYGCQASNVWGSESREAYLMVVEPRIPVRTTDDSVTVVPWYANPDQFGPDLYPPRTARTPGLDYFSTKPPHPTTKHPKGRKNKDRKNRRKDKNKHRKNKDHKNDMGGGQDVGMGGGQNVVSTKIAMPSTLSPESTFPKMDPTETAVVWEYDRDKVKNGLGEQGPDDMDTDDRLKNLGGEEKGSTGAKGSDGSSGTISSWTIYTIVGAVGGVVLLIGLVAITLTLCCRREDGGVYKSTSV